MPLTRIVIALEPGRVSPEAIELGDALARASDAPIGLLAIWRWWEPVELALMVGEPSLREEARQALRAVGERLRARGHNVTERVEAATSIGSALHDAAAEDTTGLLILGPAHHSGIGRVVAGSTASNFLHGAPCPVAIPPRGFIAPAGWPQRIGVAYADTDEGREALRGGAALARSAGRPLRVVAVADTRITLELALAPGYGVAEILEARRETTKRAVEDAIGALPAGVTAEAVTLAGDPVAKLADAGDELDLLVCGSRSYGPLGALLFGSVSRPLLHHTSIPLLVVPRGRERRLEELLDKSKEHVT